MRSSLCALLAALITLLASPSPCLADVGSGTTNMRGARYGEVLVVKGRPANLEAHVFCTLGLNSCPESAWSKIDPKAVKKQFGAWMIVMNGPRHFLMNRVSASKAGPVTNICGLSFREMATVRLPAVTLLEGAHAKPYGERAIQRTTEYVFEKGNRVYELVDPKGSVYVMQSYALIKDPALTEAALEALGARLALPKGWTYRTRVLGADLHVRATGQAHVVQDELDNTYQRVMP